MVSQAAAGAYGCFVRAVTLTRLAVSLTLHALTFLCQPKTQHSHLKGWCRTAHRKGSKRKKKEGYPIVYIDICPT